MKTENPNFSSSSYIPSPFQKKLQSLIFFLLLTITLFGQNVEIQGNATITGTVEVMDTILFSDGTSLASACLQILSDSDSDTKIEVEHSPDEDIIRFTIAGNEIARLVGNRLEFIGSGNSVFIGTNSGQNSTGLSNVGIGTYSFASNTTGQNNVAIGENSMSGVSSGDHNVAIGSEAGSSMGNGDNNTMIGHNAGYEATGNGNVLIGNSAGEEATGNQLYIDNTATNTPLIYGEFDNNLVRINGKMSINASNNIGAANFTIHDLDGSFGGMYVNATSTGMPFYGYAHDGFIRGFHFIDPSNNWIFNKSGIAMTINNQNYLKIGAGLPAERLDVNGAIRVGNTVNDNLGTIRFNNSDFEGRTGSGWVSLTGSGGSGDNDWLVSGLNIYRASGNVGIGNTSPTAPLHVTGSSKIDGKVTIGNNDLFVSNLQGDSDKGIKFGSSSTGLIGLTFENNGPYQDKLHFKTFYDQLGSSFMTMDGSNGNVGVKTTSPQYPLHVNGASKFDGSMQINENNIAQKGLQAVVTGLSSTAIRGDATSTGNSTNYGGYFTSNGTNGHAVVGVAGSLVGNNYGGYFRAWGDNGIGIYANASGGLWSAQLFGDVEANGDLYVKSDDEGSLYMYGRFGLLGRVLSRNNGDGVMYLGDVDDTGTDVHIMQSGEEAITIKNGGNVGIGTTSPNFSLDVTGEEANDHIMRIRNKANSSDADGLLIDLDYGNPGSENNFITFESNNNVAGRIEGFQWNPAGNYMDYPDVNFEDYFDIDALNSTFQEGDIVLENLLSCFDHLICPPSPTFPFTPTCQECQEILTVATFTFNNLWQPAFANDVLDKAGPVFEWNLRNGILDMAAGPFDIAMRASPEYWNRFALEGDGGVTYGSKGADYAEWLERENPEQEIKAGQIVGVRNGKISLTTENADQIMVISVMPVVLGNMPDSTRKEDYEKVAFIGQSPVWVVGEVHSGDYIIASGLNDGFGLAISSEELKIEQIPMIVGRAWEDGNKVINLVNMAVGLKTNEMTMILSNMSDEIKTIDKRLAKLESMLDMGSLALKE